jgi:hypothetical protein
MTKKEDRPRLNHFAFIMEPHDYQFVIDALTPLTRNSHCGDLARELIVAMSRAQEGKVFHIFAETGNDKPARYLHNDPNFEREIGHGES